MKLSKRLKSVAEQIMDSEVTADIGCDHGFTSIYLIRTGRAKRVIAADVGKEPLNRAKEHILQYGMQDRIELRQSDGLERIREGEADTLIISGLGGQLMCRILREGKKKLSGVRKLVLSPQSDISMVRKLIHETGFCIQRECMVFDAKKYYVILSAVPGTEKYETEVEYVYGRYLAEHGEPVFGSYMKDEYRKVTEVIRTMEKTRLSGEGNRRLEYLREKKEQIVQILHKMNIPE